MASVFPIEMHKTRIVQKTTLPPIRQRLRAIEEGGYNTFLLRTRDVFIDMLTDSGTNAMSDNQLAAMMVSDDAYAGGESYYKLLDAVKDVLGFEYCVPVHQGRAAEHLLAKIIVKSGGVVPMNYHFTTTKAHFEMALGKVLEIFCDDALQTESTNPFKGNLDLDKFQKVIDQYGAERVPVRPHGGDHEPDRRSAVFAGQSSRRPEDRGKIRDPGGHRLQPDLRKRVLHPTAGSGLRRQDDRRDRPRDDEPSRPDLLVGPQEHLRARRADRDAAREVLRHNWWLGCRSTKALSPTAACRPRRSRP